MNLKALSFIFKVTKIAIIFLLGGLAVHFGMVAPRGDFSLDHSGIFGSFYLRVVELTLALYVLYRVSVGLAKTRFGKQEVTGKKISRQTNQYFEKDDPFIKELTMFVFVVLPIVIGITLSRSSVDLPSALWFHVLRFVMFFVVLTSVWMIAQENVEFSKPE